MKGMVLSTNPNGYQLTNNPLRCDNNCNISLVYYGEQVNIIDDTLACFYKVESLDKQKSGYILKDHIKILTPGVDAGFDPNEVACLI